MFTTTNPFVARIADGAGEVIALVPGAPRPFDKEGAAVARCVSSALATVAVKVATAFDAFDQAEPAVAALPAHQRLTSEVANALTETAPSYFAPAANQG